MILLFVCTVSVTMLYTVLLHSFSSHSIHTGAPYNRSGRIVPLHTVYRVSWLSHQLCFADFHTVGINCVHFPDMYIMCSILSNLLSKIVLIFSFFNLILKLVVHVNCNFLFPFPFPP